MTTSRDLVLPFTPAGDARVSVSLHLLVKNGAGVVGRLLDCAGPYVREVVAVCDGCTDGTADVLRESSVRNGVSRCEVVEIGPRTHPQLYVLDVPETYREGRSLLGEVYQGPFTGREVLADFAGARNLGWGLCREPWRLVLDADDVVDDLQCLLGLCAALADAGVDAAASQYYHSPGVPVVRERLCRNLSEISWAGKVHERLSGYDPARVATLGDALVVRDLRDSSGDGIRISGRNLKVLYYWARKCEWRLSVSEMLYLAAEARDVMPELSYRLLECCVESGVGGGGEEGAAKLAERSWACYLHGCLDEQACRYETAAGWYQRSLSLRPTPSAAARLARTCFVLGWHEEVVRAHEVGKACRGGLHYFGDGEVDGSVEILVASSLAEIGSLNEAVAMVDRLQLRYPQNVALVRLRRQIRREASESV